MSFNSNTGGRGRYSAARVAFMGLLFALAMVFSFIEGMIPAFLPAGIRLGLSNIVTMYCLFFLGWNSAYTLAILKALFVLLTRGPIASAMSLAGGRCAVTVMIILTKPKKLNLSYMVLSIGGAVSHNIGQLIMAYFLINSSFVYYYIPVMVISGAVMGTVTSMVLRIVLPYINKLKVSLK